MLCLFTAILAIQCKQEEKTVPPVFKLSQTEITVPSEGGGCLLLYTVENSVSDGSVSASVAEDCDWIDGIRTEVDGEIAFTVSENKDTAPRSCSMAIVYVCEETEPQSFTVKVLQEGAGTAQSVTVSREQLSLNVGDTARLYAEAEPAEFSEYIIWSSDNSNVATVTEDGKVTAVSPGQAIISASVGEVSGQCTVSVEEAPKAYTVHAAGYHDKIMYSFYWKTGDTETSMLSDASRSTRAHSVWVSGSDVYIGGESTVDEYGYLAATVWKNGQPTYLTDTSLPIDGAVYSLCADGSDVYAAGFYRVARSETTSFRRDAAVVWKNSEPFDLTDGSNYAQARAVTVAGGTVYAVGESSNGDGYSVATLWSSASGTWEDKQTKSLADGSNHTYAQSVCVADGDVYVAGYGYDTQNYYVAMLWKNDEPVQLISQGAQSYAYSVCVADGHVYVAGWEYKVYDGAECAVATLWVDSKPYYLTDEKKSSQARCVFVKDGNVYVSGFLGDQAVIWENGEPVCITDGSDSAAVTSVFVTED